MCDDTVHQEMNVTMSLSQKRQPLDVRHQVLWGQYGF